MIIGVPKEIKNNENRVSLTPSAGSVETIDRITTHDNPCFEKYGVIHYSVANMPGAVPMTSTYSNSFCAKIIIYILNLKLNQTYNFHNITLP